MPVVESKKKVTRTLKFIEVFTNKGKYAGGGIGNSLRHTEDEIWVEIVDDPVPDNSGKGLVTSGRPQIHIGGTRQAFEELGVFFLALAHYQPERPGYSHSFHLGNTKGDPTLHLVVHLPQEDEAKRKQFSVVHTVARTYIAEDDQREDKDAGGSTH